MKAMGSGHGNKLGFNCILQSSPCLSRESHGKKICHHKYCQDWV